MLAHVSTFTIDGLDPRRVSVEVDIRPGLPSFRVVGLADIAVREARERVRAALLNSGFDFPLRRITANLAPADLRKVGPGFDLALAAAVLAASGQLACEPLATHAVFGELSLSGEIRPCPGALAVAEGTRRAGLAGLVLPGARAAEAALVDGIAVLGVGDLRQMVAVLAGEAPPPAPVAAARRATAPSPPDLAEVRGQAAAVEALTIAAAGGHNLLMEGPPGTGKTMLARRLPSILPPLEGPQALEVTRIHSIAGLHDGHGLITTPPFRAPHHTVSAAGLVGGGSVPQPGEASLAHRGVLFLDELAEFGRAALEALRQPLEDGHVAIVRGQRALAFPTRAMLVAATNPCPCGFAGSDRCRCTATSLARYRDRLSGPLLDRIDLVIPVGRPSTGDLAGAAPTSSAVVRDAVAEARERQRHRLGASGPATNAGMDDALLRRHAHLTAAADTCLASLYETLGLSMRGRERIVRVARTIADLAGRDRVERGDVLRAASLRRDDVAAEVAR